MGRLRGKFVFSTSELLDWVQGSGKSISLGSLQTKLYDGKIYRDGTAVLSWLYQQMRSWNQKPIELVSVMEAVQLSGKTKQAIYKRISVGTLVSYVVGGKVYVAVADLRDI